MLNERTFAPPDQTAILICHAAAWSQNRAVYEASLAPLSDETKATSLRAARFARAAFTGPIGELITREIRSYVDDGHVVPWRHIAPRLVAAMAHRENRFPLGEPGANKANPVIFRYIPGSNLRYIGPASRPSAP